MGQDKEGLKLDYCEVCKVFYNAKQNESHLVCLLNAELPTEVLLSLKSIPDKDQFILILQEKLDIALEALERYAQGRALQLRVDKRDVWADRAKWHERSMSDWCDKMTAREALEEINHVK